MTDQARPKRHDCPGPIRLAAYHDRELTPAEARAVEDHLAVCRHCHRALGRLKSLSELFRTAPQPQPPAGLLERVHALLRQSEARPLTATVRLCRAALLAAAAVLLAVGLWHTGPGPQHVRPPADWEVVAVTLDPQSATDGTEEALALWIVSDLTKETPR